MNYLLEMIHLDIEVSLIELIISSISFNIWAEVGLSETLTDQHLFNSLVRDEGVDFGNFQQSSCFSNKFKTSSFDNLENGNSPFENISHTKHAKE